MDSRPAGVYAGGMFDSIRDWIGLIVMTQVVIAAVFFFIVKTKRRAPTASKATQRRRPKPPEVGPRWAERHDKPTTETDAVQPRDGLTETDGPS